MEEGFGEPLKDRSASGSGLNSLFPGQSPYKRVFPHAPVTMNCAAFPVMIGLKSFGKWESKHVCSVLLGYGGNFVKWDPVGNIWGHVLKIECKILVPPFPLLLLGHEAIVC